jgi:hypothetical protein
MEHQMRAYRIEKIISQDGVLELRGLPFHAGEIVEVIILSREDRMPGGHHSTLKGKVLRYDNPTDPVAPDDWEALQ